MQFCQGQSPLAVFRECCIPPAIGQICSPDFAVVSNTVCMDQQFPAYSHHPDIMDQFCGLPLATSRTVKASLSCCPISRQVFQDLTVMSEPLIHFLEQQPLSEEWASSLSGMLQSRRGECWRRPSPSPSRMGQQEFLVSVRSYMCRLITSFCLSPIQVAEFHLHQASGHQHAAWNIQPGSVSITDVLDKSHLSLS
jgi:hypothetical protein